ncbi:alpha/beta hydrolase [Pelagicoccus albus]|uniref:Alpha/beta hydrolase n=1 Tax=Pelagicoccus albus TaxID=415222 RepID=A0A7X1B9W1_9BACT|nr:alpha/beta hydrolase [Pelagicoccus albus]MBC2607078.1 alpha/beta hydrolase [Pelagicoccus albus]
MKRPSLFSAIASAALLIACPTLNSSENPSMQETNEDKSYRAFLDLEYVPNAHPQQRLDIFLPAEGEGPWPLVIWIHGGGWKMGSKSQCVPYHMKYFEKGFAVASLDYRLTDVATFPAQIQDVKAAVRWLRSSSSEYGFDPNKFGVWGDSAGGHLSALLGTSHGYQPFEVGENLEISSAVQAVCDYYGPTEFVSFVQTPGYKEHADEESAETALLGARVLDRPDLAATASPLAYLSPDDPPFLIVHGDQDPVVPLNQSEQLRDKLKEAGVPVKYFVLEGAAHGGPEFRDEALKDTVLQFFKDTLSDN